MTGGPGIPVRCPRCDRGREACAYCHDIGEQGFEAICDCGLYDFGSHLLDCRERDAYRWVIPADYESAELPR